MRVLVTGAAGKTGRAMIAALHRQGVTVRAFVRDARQQEAARAAGAAEMQIGDLRQPSEVSQAAQEVQAIYHICPNMHPNEISIGQAAIAAAQDNGVPHFVFHSVFHPQVDKIAANWHKLRVEELLFESGLAYTILQPTAYMHNILGYWSTIVGHGVFRPPYPVSTRLSLVDLADVADVGVQVLLETGHQGATYELVGTEPLTQTAVARIISQHLNLPVRAEETPLDEWRDRARASGHLSNYSLDTLTEMFRYYARYGAIGNPRILTHLLGRAPTSLSAFLANNAPETA